MTPKESKAKRFEEIKKRVMDQRSKREENAEPSYSAPQALSKPEKNPFGNSSNILQFPSGPLPVSIVNKGAMSSNIPNLVNIAKDSTARDIVGSLDLVNDSLVEGLVDIATDTNQVKMIKSIEEGFENLGRSLSIKSMGAGSSLLADDELMRFNDVGVQAKETLGVFGKIGRSLAPFRNILSNFLPFLGKASGRIKDSFMVLVSYTFKQTEYLQSVNKGVHDTVKSVNNLTDWIKALAKQQDQRFEKMIDSLKNKAEKTDGILSKFFFANSNNEDIRKSVMDNGKHMSIKQNLNEKANNGWSNMFGGTKLNADDSKIKGFMLGAVGILGTLANLGFWFGKAVAPLMTGAGNMLISLGTGAGPLLGNLGNLLKVVAGLGGFMTAIGTIAVSAMAWSIIKDPSYIGKYMEAFGNLFEQSIGPTLKWIGIEIIPRLALVFGALLVAFEAVMTSLGNFLNDGAIYLIGSVLPATFEAIGEGISGIWDLLKILGTGIVEMGLRIAGMVGIGPYGSEGLVANIVALFKNTFDTVAAMLDSALGTIIKYFNIDKMLGIDGTEYSLLGIIGKFFVVTLPDWLSTGFATLATWFNNLSIVQTIQDKVMGMVNGIIDLIPNWEDIKGFLRGIVPEHFHGMMGLMPQGIDPINTDIGRDVNAFRDMFGKNLNPSVMPAQEPSDMYTPSNSLYQQYLAEEAIKNSRMSTGAPIIQNNVNNSSNSTNNVSGGSGGSNARPTTAPAISHWDKQLFGIESF